MTSMNFLISIPYRLNRKIFLIRLVIMTENIGFLYFYLLREHCIPSRYSLYSLFLETGYENSYSLKRSKELCDSNGVAGLRTDSSL